MSKFKVGDKIRCVDNSYWSEDLTKGKVYVVVEEATKQDFVRIVSDRTLHVGGYSVERFELVQEDTSLTPEEVFEHLRNGTKLEVFGRHNTRTGSFEKWVDAPKEFTDFCVTIDKFIESMINCDMIVREHLYYPKA